MGRSFTIPRLSGDKEALKICLSNIFKNATQHTFGGEIKIVTLYDESKCESNDELKCKDSNETTTTTATMATKRSDQIIKLNVGGEKFTTSRSTMTNVPNNFFE